MSKTGRIKTQTEYITLKTHQETHEERKQFLWLRKQRRESITLSLRFRKVRQDQIQDILSKAPAIYYSLNIDFAIPLISCRVT